MENIICALLFVLLHYLFLEFKILYWESRVLCVLIHITDISSVRWSRVYFALGTKGFLKKSVEWSPTIKTHNRSFCESSLDNLTLCQANVKSVEKRSGWPMIWSSKQKATTATWLITAFYLTGMPVWNLFERYMYLFTTKKMAFIHWKCPLFQEPISLWSLHLYQ